MRGIEVRGATQADVPLTLMRELAEDEKLSHEVVATVDGLRGWLFGAKPAAEVLIGLLRTSRVSPLRTRTSPTCTESVRLVTLL